MTLFIPRANGREPSTALGYVCSSRSNELSKAPRRGAIGENRGGLYRTLYLIVFYICEKSGVTRDAVKSTRRNALRRRAEAPMPGVWLKFHGTVFLVTSSRGCP